MLSRNHIIEGRSKNMRDVRKQAEQGKKIIRKHEKADLSVSKIHQLVDIFKDTQDDTNSVLEGVYEAVVNAFLMGVAVGSRNA